MFACGGGVSTLHLPILFLSLVSFFRGVSTSHLRILLFLFLISFFGADVCVWWWCFVLSIYLSPCFSFFSADIWVRWWCLYCLSTCLLVSLSHLLVQCWYLGAVMVFVLSVYLPSCFFLISFFSADVCMQSWLFVLSIYLSSCFSVRSLSLVLMFACSDDVLCLQVRKKVCLPCCPRRVCRRRSRPVRWPTTSTSPSSLRSSPR